MVSFWPWKGDDSSPAAFEKALSQLSGKIGKASSSLETTRQQGRRAKALWTLYSSFAYLIYLMIAVLVVGWKNWGPVEYTVVSTTPASIYLMRFALASYYNYRTANQQAYLQSLQKQRDDKINKLKEATKYNTTQQLLEKYGGNSIKTGPRPRNERSREAQETGSIQKRRGTTGFMPPPTANIPGRRIASASSPNSPEMPDGTRFQGEQPHQPPQSASASVAPWRQEEQPHTMPSADFAPNAFDEPRVYESHGSEGAKWYDRLMDVVLGEDESSPRNRLALICQSCRLVNGQAPPGVKTLEDVGKWKCSACGMMNGQESEAKRIVASMTGRAGGSGSAPSSPRPVAEEVEEVRRDGEESDHTVYSEEEVLEPEPTEEEEEPEKEPLSKPKKRGRPKKDKS